MSTTNPEIIVRTLRPEEVGDCRLFVARHPDHHLKYVVQRLPKYPELMREFDNDSQFLARQSCLVGAFAAGDLIGAVAVERVAAREAPTYSEADADRFWSRFTQHDLDVYDALTASIAKTYIGVPIGSLAIHSLGVDQDYRRQGIATALISRAIEETPAADRPSLHIEFARLGALHQLGSNLGFTKVKSTFSFSERLEYGCWGSTLMRYRAT